MIGISCPAANFNWAAPQKISGDSDVSLNGVLVRAINATPTNTTLAMDVTLNGVTFVAATKSGSGLYVAPGGDTFLPSDTSSVGPGTFQAFGQGGAPFNTLSATYSNLLCTAYWNDGTDIGNTWAATAGYDWMLNNLTVGRTYELQVWVNDSRLSNLGQNNPGLFTSVMDTNGNSVNLEHNGDNLLGGVGQYVLGTFTADAPSQALRLIGGNTVGADTSGSTATSLLNAYQLRDISPAGAPRFTSVMPSGMGIILSGTNGPANGAYEMLRSTNVSEPVAAWQGVGIRPFDANGNFSFTNPISSEIAAAFYRLLVVSSVPVFPPVITAPPQDASIAVGQNANFNVTATGTSPLTYRWYFNTNTLVAAGSSASLTITNAQLTNAGTISVTVSNLIGSRQSGFATLTLTNNTQPPGILAQPTNLTVFVGQNATFGVTASGALPLHYQWYFNTNTMLAGKTNSTLTLADVQLTNAGKYSVTITNLFGATNSAFATLTVNSNASPELIGWASVAGYGQATTTGGGTNTPIVVTDVATLRTLAGDSTPRVLILSGTFNAGSSAITIANNKTLRGVDANVVIQGGIDINTKSNIIIQNLTIQGNGFGFSPADTAASRTCHHLWFDHVTFSDAGDGLLDLTIGSDFITVSWCKFFYTDPLNTHRLCSLVGNSSNATNTDTGKNNVTYHHNWFAELVDQRMPRLLFGKGHMFNNYYNSPGNGYCIGTGSWGSALVENNYFKQVNSPHQSQDGNPSYIAASGNVYDNTTGNTHTGLLNPDNDGNDPGPWIPPYSYTLDPVANVPSMVTAGAGPQ